MALLDKSEVLKGNMKYMIALISDIMDGKPVKFIVNKKSYSCKVEITKTIKQLNDAISNQEASTVQNILHTKDRPAKYHDIFETKIGNLKLSQIDKSPYSGAGGKKPDPHELMTAALILKKEVIKTSHLNQSNGKRAEYIRSLTKEID